ncbi:cold-shock protein [Acrocarpospora macrocephala]|nr:cold shock domain-containing protein [Acrocarpospora macrocephala]
MARGTVKFWKSDKGWGAISSPELPEGHDAWAHFSDIIATGFRELHPGDEVECTLVQRKQDSFDFCATAIRKL